MFILLFQPPAQGGECDLVCPQGPPGLNGSVVRTTSYHVMVTMLYSIYIHIFTYIYYTHIPVYVARVL